MKDEYSLTPLERGYKQLYLSGQTLDSIKDADSFNDFFAEFGIIDFAFYQEHMNFALRTPVWEEDSFFPEGRDITIMRYPRYLPAYEHSHNFFEIYYVRRLPAEQKIDGMPFGVSEGDMLILSPGTWHSFGIMDDTGITYLIAVRKSTFIKAFSALFNQDNVLSAFFLQTIYQAPLTPYLLFKTGYNPKIDDIIMDMLEESDPDIPFSGYMMNLHFQRLCAQLMRYHKDFLYIQDGYSDDIAKMDMTSIKILKYVMDNCQDFSLSEAARHFNYSEAHLCRIVKKYTGKTLTDIRNTARIQNAVPMLAHSLSISIEEISHLVGFSDTTAFNKAFKKIHGITPAEYRKKYANSKKHG